MPIAWNRTNPDGQPGRMLDGSRAEKKFGGRAKVKFEEGLKSLGMGCLDGKMDAESTLSTMNCKFIIINSSKYRRATSTPRNRQLKNNRCHQLRINHRAPRGHRD